MGTKKTTKKKISPKRKYAVSSWKRVEMARHPRRPMMLDYVASCFDDFIELHGDRHIGDDEAMPAGLVRINGIRCVVIGHEKGRDTDEKLKRNFGSAGPEGYRKALRMMKFAQKFKLPLISIIDTPGAYPGVGAEERNIAESIAYNLREMMMLRTQIIAIVIGEGGSGGALGIGVADRVMMMENSYYSVISPEGCAAILWKDRKYAPDAANAMKLDAKNLKRLGIIDRIVREPTKGAHTNPSLASKNLKDSILDGIKELSSVPIDQLLADRYKKYRAMGEFID
ncbi:MAG: acetyl-CoA carboxylase carboxyltransferase subunit alpha [Verrucomicrobiaceae bacterium]|nr:MAG: acetyl-CoA carboxylase carboxyltransferase subunit alpha [Verrucomicrobiaceae bacterium]